MASPRKIKRILEKYQFRFEDLPIATLTDLFRDALEEYWDSSNAVTLAISRRLEGRLDLELGKICSTLEMEIRKRPYEEVIGLQALLKDNHPGVRLRVARLLKSYSVEDAITTLRELALRPNGLDGLPDVYAANARVLLE